MNKGWRLGAHNEANYLAKVKQLYGQIGQQCSGLLWKDGGPIIGIQLENEYDGPGGTSAHALSSSLATPVSKRTLALYQNRLANPTFAGAGR